MSRKAAPSERRTAEPGPARPRAPSRRAAVLVVDDHEENLLAMEAVLKDLGHEIVLARSGEEALKSLLERDFAAILLDVSMPDLDGFQTASMIRQRDRSRDTPIIFLTAFSKSETQIARGYSVGAVDYILKPFAPEIIRAKVEVFVELHEKAELIREQGELLRRLESREHRRRLAEARAQRNRFFFLSLDLMCTLGFDGMLKEVNPAWEAVLGWSRRELLALPFLERIHPADREATRAHWLLLESRGGHFPAFENRCLRRDGSFRWLLWSSSTQLAERLHYAVARDITDRKAGEDSLRAARDELEERVRERTAALEKSNADLSMFAYTVSHELQEPARKVTAFGDLLEASLDAGDAAGGRDCLARMKNAARNMQSLIRDILALGRITAAAGSFQPADLGAILRDSIAGFRPQIDAAGAEIEADELPAIDGDPMQLRLLFDNLLSNALKFRRPEAPPRVRIRLSRPAPGGIQIEVEDNGIGFEAQYREKIFHPFQRLHSRGQFEGTGLGLAICARIVSRHSGTISAEGTPGKGAVVTVRLPR